MSFHTEQDGPAETWHMNAATAYAAEGKYVDAYNRLFGAANGRLQKFFMTIGARIHHDHVRDYGLNTIYDETLRMDLSYDGRESLAAVLERGWESAKRHYHYSHLENDPTKPRLDCPEEWRKNYENVENYLKAMDMVSENQQLKENILQSLITDIPANIKYLRETWEEEYEFKKYTINHHFTKIYPDSYYNVNY
uniref:Superoxide dismutase n=1 Tax=Caenorhabditis tropicalis TaxID=1561998 RepID=A0A1I7TBI3_9PELO